MGKFARAVVLAAAFSSAAIVGSSQIDRDYSAPRSPERVPPEQRVDVNHATLDELLKVPGMTRPWALRILRFKPYRTKQDLLDEGVLPSAVYARIREYLIAHRQSQ